MDFWFWFLIFWIIATTGAIAGISAAPWVPTKKRDTQLLVDKLKIQPGHIVYDLGCGTGTILIALARKHPKATFIGCEISALPYAIAKIRSLWHKNLHIKYRNLFKYPIRDADFVVAFLLIKAYERLAIKFQAELKPSATIAIEAWAIDGVRPREVIKRDKTLPFYIYQGSDFK